MPTGKKHTTVGWDDGGKIGKHNKLILTEIFPSVHETFYLKESFNLICNSPISII